MLNVHEYFYTFQGEGVHMGRAAFFIRLFGCPQKCPWCDSAGTWHPDYVPPTVNKLKEETLVAEAVRSGAAFVVITGGEPAIYDLSDLTEQLHRAGLKIHIETSGAYTLKGKFDWTTLSPKDKWARPALAENIRRASEIKLIIEGEEDIEYWYRWLEFNLLLPAPVVWLHPEWSRHNNYALMTAITQAVKKYPTVFRAGYQIHKMYRADANDTRTQPLAPLGGNPKLGY